MTNSSLTDEQKAIYQWQISVPGFGEEGQQKLANTTALISRCGGLGSPVAYSLAAAGFGKLIIAHGGNVKHSDLNRQILMTDASIDTPRIESVKKKLNEFNPRMEVEGIASNITEENAEELVSKADIVFDCAPLFTERFALNRQCVLQNKPMIEAAMYSLEGQIMTIIPGQTACLACLYPEDPPQWKRQFPVFGAVSALAAQIAVMEGIKVISGIGETLAGTLLYYDTADMTFQKIAVKRNPNCKICAK